MTLIAVSAASPVIVTMPRIKVSPSDRFLTLNPLVGWLPQHHSGGLTPFGDIFSPLAYDRCVAVVEIKNPESNKTP